MGLWRAYKIGSQGKEVLESEGERVFENGKDSLYEMVGRVTAAAPRVESWVALDPS